MGRIIEKGKGEVWSFTAAANMTSGIAVFLSGSEKVGIAHYSNNAIGVTLTPASAGKQVSVILQGVAEVESTGAIVFGDWVQATGAGKVATGVFVSGARPLSARGGGPRSLCLGYVIKSPTRDEPVRIIVTL